MVKADVYREMCNEYGKEKIWSLKADELCDLIEEHYFGNPF